MKNLVWLLLILFVVSGCSSADTTGSSTIREYNIEITNTAGSTLKLSMPVTASTEGVTDQVTDNDPTNTISPSTSLGLNGGTASTAAQAAEQALDGISSVLQTWQDNRKKDSENDNRVDNSVRPATPPVIKVPVPDKVDKIQPVPGTYNTVETFELRNLKGNNKPFTWLKKTGSDYGGQIKFIWPDCGELIVTDASVTQGADGTGTNHNQAFYFCGTDSPIGSPENMNNMASIFGPPGCAAKIVTLHYNEVAE